MMKRRGLLFAALASVLPVWARAEDYLAPDAAARLLFPEATGFSPADAVLDDAAAKAIKAASGMTVRQKKLKSFAAVRGGQVVGYVYIDDVIGKHEFITYAAGIDGSDAVRGVEILAYRETWGKGVLLKAWRDQFKGKTLNAPPVLGKGIQNISGGTLSCRNVTDGVRRLLATHAVLKR